MKQKKQLLRQTAQDDGRRGRYQVGQRDGFYYAYQEDGGGQDRGPTHFGVFVSEEEARKRVFGVSRKPVRFFDLRKAPN